MSVVSKGGSQIKKIQKKKGERFRLLKCPNVHLVFLTQGS